MSDGRPPEQLDSRATRAGSAGDLPNDSLADLAVGPASGSAGAADLCVAPAGSNLTPVAAPASLSELFFAFTWLALQGFGGVLPVAQRELVERHRWLSREQFVEMLAVSQVLPGPNVVNLALMYGDRAFGWRGALVALAGMLTIPMLVVLALTAVYGRFAAVPAVGGALRGMGAVAAGLVISTAFKLLVTLRRNTLGPVVGLGLAALMALGSAWLHWPLIWLLAGLGVVACSLAWHRLEP